MQRKLGDNGAGVREEHTIKVILVSREAVNKEFALSTQLHRLSMHRCEMNEGGGCKGEMQRKGKK